MSLPIPAELTIQSSRPWRAITARTINSTLSGSCTSTCSGKSAPEPSVVSFAERSEAMTVAPSLTIRCAMASPIPDKPPVTTAIFPSS